MKYLMQFAIGGALSFVASNAYSQTVLSETTWGGFGSDVAYGVAVDSDGSSYVTGITDSFATDQFGNPSQRIFLTRFAADGSLDRQRIWNGQTLKTKANGSTTTVGISKRRS